DSSPAPSFGAAPAGNGVPGALDFAQFIGAAPQGGVFGPNTGRVMSALGAGLSSARQNWNKPAAAPFASGAGAAIHGGPGYDNALQNAKLKALQTAIAGWKVGDMAAFHQATTSLRALTAQRTQSAASASPAAPPAASGGAPANNPPAPATNNTSAVRPATPD